MTKKLKKILIALVIIAVVAWLISAASGDTPAPDESDGALSSTAGMTSSPLPPSAASSSGAAEGVTDFAGMLSSVKSINIDTAIFSSPAYKALRDHPISLGTDIVGRTNPFAPVGSDSGSAPINPTVQTLQPGKITSASAELSAQVSFSTTAPVSVVFQYGPSDTFGSVTSPQTLSKSGTAVATISGLIPDTTYHVQAVAVVGSTTTTGNTMTFTTTTPPTQ